MTANKDKKQLPPIMIDRGLYEKAQNTAKQEGRSLSNLIRIAIDKYCDRPEELILNAARLGAKIALEEAGLLRMI